DRQQYVQPTPKRNIAKKAALSKAKTEARRSYSY
ncbi:30S ribosomal protein S21, partial [Francisella tularensis subsp. holarctica]|nr:30S ribosomal protein S21 [Francisella tularensis subsp. holarctica]